MKKINNKIFLRICFISFVIVISLGMLVSFIINDPILFTTSINDSKKINVLLDNVSADVTGNATYTLPKVRDTSLSNYNVIFYSATSTVTYNFTLTNKNNEDVILTKIIQENPLCFGSSPSDNKIVCDNLEYKLFYNDSSNIKIGDKLKQNETKKLKLIIKVPDNLNGLVSFPIKIDNLDIKLIYTR